MLKQCHRETDEQGRILATLEDYSVRRELVLDTMAKEQGALIPECMRPLVSAVYRLLEEAPDTGIINEPEITVSQQTLSELTTIPQLSISRSVADASDRGLLVNGDGYR